MRIRRRTLYGTLVILLTATALVVVRSYVLKNVQDSLLDRIEALNKSEIKIHYDTIFVDWKRNVLTIEKLVIEKDAYDTTCIYPEFISCGRVTIKGLGLLSLIFRNEIDIDQISLINPHWVIHEKSELLALDSMSRKAAEFEFYVKRVAIDSMRIEFLDSTECAIKSRVRTNAFLRDLNVSVQPDRGKDFSFSEIRTNESRIDIPSIFYTFTIRESTLNLQDHSFTLDTLRIIPSFGKLQFGRMAGNDLDRIEGVIPFFKIKDLNLQYADTLLVDAGLADIQFFLRVFHDKRLPHERKIVPLPLAQIKKIPFGLMVDQLVITKSFVEYEEIPAEADESGKIFFDNLEATLSSVTNDPYPQSKEMVLEAKGDFMGKGKVSVTAIFPHDLDQQGTVTGSLRTLPFTRLNSMVEPAANIKFESGMLNRLDFSFRFNDRISNGEVSLNYEDLKVLSFKSDEQMEKAEKRKHKSKKSEDDLRKDNFKTFIINAFLVKKNLDETVPAEKRSGTIHFERDRSRSIFNFWWKSVFTGVKSAFNLDKAEATVEKLKSRKKK
ncbi:MAG TPA: DUF748 domain-containing protein [Chryseosolibacter sp.]